MIAREERCKHCGRMRGFCHESCPGYEDDGLCGAIMAYSGPFGLKDLGYRCRMPSGHYSEEENNIHSDGEAEVWWADQCLTTDAPA